MPRSRRLSGLRRFANRRAGTRALFTERGALALRAVFLPADLRVAMEPSVALATTLSSSGRAARGAWLGCGLRDQSGDRVRAGLPLPSSAGGRAVSLPLARRLLGG